MKYVRTQASTSTCGGCQQIGANYSMTWSFASPDGRALFRLANAQGETVVVWLRIGNHSIYGS